MAIFGGCTLIMPSCRGGVDCKRIWQIGMEHASTEEEEDFDTESLAGSAPATTICSSGGMCRWFRDDNSIPLKPGTTGLWVNVFSETGRSGQVCLGHITAVFINRKVHGKTTCLVSNRSSLQDARLCYCLWVKFPAADILLELALENLWTW